MNDFIASDDDVERPVARHSRRTHVKHVPGSTHSSADDGAVMSPAVTPTVQQSARVVVSRLASSYLSTRVVGCVGRLQPHHPLAQLVQGVPATQATSPSAGPYSLLGGMVLPRGVGWSADTLDLVCGRMMRYDMPWVMVVCLALARNLV